MIKVPKEVTKIMKTLGDAGFENYVTGECVIDSMMGEKTYSWDVITKAGFEELTELFPEAKILSTKYSVLREELIDEICNEKGEVIGEEGYIIDISTYRIKNASESSGDDENLFTDNVEEDLARRDFTIDAIAMNPYAGVKPIVDPYEGREDVRKKIIKTVGEASEHDEGNPLCSTVRIRLT